MESTTSLCFMPMICDDSTLTFYDAISYASIGIVLGFLFLMILFNIFMLLTIRDPLYLWYTLYLLTFMTYLMEYSGFLQSLILGLRPFIACAAQPMEGLLVLAAWTFADKANRFEVWKGTVWIRRTLYASILAVLALDFLGEQRLASELVLSISGAMLLVADAGTILQLLHGNRLSRFFVVGWSCLLVSFGWLILGAMGVPGPFMNMVGNLVSILVGVMIETTCFSLALAFRFRFMQRELESFQERNSQADRLGTLGLMAAQVGHEISAPNHVIALNASLLTSLHHKVKEDRDRLREDGLSEAPDDSGKLVEAESLVKAIVKASGQIHQVLTNLRSEVRPQDRPVPVDLGMVLRLTSELNEIRWRQDTSRMTVQTPATPVIIEGVEFRLQQLIVNLVTNALHSLGDRDKAVQLRVEARGNEAILTVADEGQGMSAEVQARLGTPFFTTRWSQEGSGFGWGLCQEIVKEHKASLELQSRPGAGTTVRVRFPYASVSGSRPEG
jgi:signal transduction histidine kinase